MKAKLLLKCLSSGLFFLLLTVQVFAQSRRVSGVVKDASGVGIPGVSVSLKGTTVGTITDANGAYTIDVGRAANPVLVFSSIGYLKQEMSAEGQSAIDISLADDAASLDEVVVTGYMTEKKKDIIGSVAVVNTKNMVQQPSSNLSSMLQGRASGLIVSGTGAPGAASKIRIRGFVSFGNNDPLYIIDGVPTDNANNLNPQDVESVQVLKDPASASIYGSRAANGVIVVTTRAGRSGETKLSYDGYYGVSAIPDRAYPRMLNTQGYVDYLNKAFAGADGVQKHAVFGTEGSLKIPQMLYTGMDVNNKGYIPKTQGDILVIPNQAPSSYGPYQLYNTSAGTDWFREATQAAPVQSHQITATGGTEKGTYSLGLNYFGQQGIFRYTTQDRYTLRANTRFAPKKWLRIGENLQISFNNQAGSNGNPADLGGGLDFSGEASPWAQAYRMVPYIPVYDLNGNFGGNGVGESGNGTNPVAQLFRGKDNRYQGFGLFGNVFAQADILKNLTFSSSFGFDQRIGNGFGFTAITYERSENQQNNAFNEYFFRGGSWTWTNSLTYNWNINDVSNLRLFAATESIAEQFRSISGSRQDYDFSDPSFLSLNTGKNLQLNGGSPSTPRTLYSVFGKAEYQLMDRYLFSATLRRDAASVFGPENRVGIFPAVGVAWRVSEEPFLKGNRVINDMKLRASWGKMGSQRNVPTTNAYSFFFANNQGTSYDITGGNGGVAIGYRPSVVGNPNTKWEAAEMINIGADFSFWNGKLDASIEYFNNTTRDLLVSRQRNGLEPQVEQPLINVGTMLNRGIDANFSTRGKITNDVSYDLGLTFTHFTNKALSLDVEGSAFFEYGAGRLGSIQRTQAGYPLSTFWGYINDGVFNSQAEVDAHASMPYKRVGSWKIRDLNGDRVIDSKDMTFLGNPLPKFQIGSDIQLRYKNFDFGTFLYWNYGNQIYNYTKWWTHLRGFVGGVSQDVLTDTSMPVLNINDTYSGLISNSWYLESGSFLRARQMQLGYTFPSTLNSKLGLSRARIYVQGQNVFTVTPYSGPDPDIGILGNELQMGVDQFRTPAPRTFLVGINLGF